MTPMASAIGVSRLVSRKWLLLHVAGVFFLSIQIAAAQAVSSAPSRTSVAGAWDAVLTWRSKPVPVRLELRQTGVVVVGAWVNGGEYTYSIAGSYRQGRLHLEFDEYGAGIDARLVGGRLEGIYRYSAGERRRPLPLAAHRAGSELPSAYTSAAAPSIAGAWELHGSDSKKSGSAWKLVLKQTGSALAGAVLQMDGITGELGGEIRGGNIVLSRFAGDAPILLRGTLTEGILRLSILTQDGVLRVTGLRPADARARGLPAPPDPFQASHVKNPEEPFHFRFPDLSGREISDRDPEFQGKPLIVSIMGSWCRQCHDEASFLVDLYQRYHGQGLEVVALSFEAGDDIASDRQRVASFVRRNSIPYPVVLAGSSEEVGKRLPQLADFAGFPTTIWIGRDARVRGMYAGFPGAPGGIEYKDFQQEANALVERLLNEPGVNSNTPPTTR